MQSEVFRALTILSAFLVCLSHGSNDVANAISPLLVLMDKAGYSKYWSFFVGSAGISLGLLVLGKKVMQTVGDKIIVLDYQKAFCV